jgi:hypothetical protein
VPLARLHSVSNPYIIHATAMIEDRELWACANLLVQQHVDGARSYADKRTADLADVGDRKGAATWRVIADRIACLGTMTSGEWLN